MSKFLIGTRKVLKLYVKNLFDGKITTLIGIFLIGMGVHTALQGQGFTESFAWISGGLALAGLKDSHIGFPDKERPKEP